MSDSKPKLKLNEEQAIATLNSGLYHLAEIIDIYTEGSKLRRDGLLEHVDDYHKGYLSGYYDGQEKFRTYTDQWILDVFGDVYEPPEDI